MKTFSIFNYPSTIVWVDDDALFLKAISRSLSKKYILKTFSNPTESLNFFKNYTPLLSSMQFLRGCVENEDYETAEHMPVDLNSAALSGIRRHPERNNEISVIVVDYNMPGMNGLDLCREIKNLPMKKILLTGEAEYAQAVSAFNEGIIDKFIKKDNPALFTEMHTYIDTLMQQYFKDSTQALAAYMETDQCRPISDPIFISFFQNWCKENNIREYYLMDKQGNFCVVDEENEVSYFIVHTDETLSAFVNVYNDNEKTANLIDSVSKREKIPFFGVGNDAWQVEIEDWHSHFYIPNKLEGREKYFWRVIK